MFCSAMTVRDTHESPKIVCNLQTHLVECSKLGKTRIIENVKYNAVRNAGFGAWDCFAPGCIRNDTSFHPAHKNAGACKSMQVPAVGSEKY